MVQKELKGSFKALDINLGSLKIWSEPGGRPWQVGILVNDQPLKVVSLNLQLGVGCLPIANIVFYPENSEPVPDAIVNPS